MVFPDLNSANDAVGYRGSFSSCLSAPSILRESCRFFTDTFQSVSFPNDFQVSVLCGGQRSNVSDSGTTILQSGRACWASGNDIGIEVGVRQCHFNSFSAVQPWLGTFYYGSAALDMGVLRVRTRKFRKPSEEVVNAVLMRYESSANVEFIIPLLARLKQMSILLHRRAVVSTVTQ